jgi:hypothetical protein
VDAQERPSLETQSKKKRGIKKTKEGSPRVWLREALGDCPPPKKNKFFFSCFNAPRLPSVPPRRLRDARGGPHPEEERRGREKECSNDKAESL